MGRRLTSDRLATGLIAIGVGIILLHLVLTWRWVGSTDQLLLNILFWAAIAVLLWHKRSRLSLQSGWVASGVGALLMGLVLVKSLALLPTESAFIRVFPGLAALALGLVASGWRLRQYGREGLIILTLMVSPGTVERLLEWSIGPKIQALVAQSAGFLLHYIGVPVISQGIEIVSRKGIVQVEYACTGVTMLLLLCQLSILFQLVFPVLGWRCRYLPLIAGGLVWLLASVRVAIMVVVIDNHAAFEYWHGKSGGQLFSTFAIVAFAYLCQHFLEEPKPAHTPQKSLEPS
jgi:cyanoexosortase A